jgi:branched-chain amino acid transport system permease protein
LTQDRIIYGIFFLVITAIGFAVENYYYLQLLTIIGINTLLALGLNMLMGYAGQISLGHAAFYGIGAYTTAILTVNYGINPWMALPCAFFWLYSWLLSWVFPHSN